MYLGNSKFIKNQQVSIFSILVLNRAKNFIPMLANANQKLEQDIGEKSADQFDIENVDEDEKFIEMVSWFGFELPVDS